MSLNVSELLKLLEIDSGLKDNKSLFEVVEKIGKMNDIEK